jgi:ATP-binding cassette subfamily B (MDR/TAP) protein 1
MMIAIFALMFTAMGLGQSLHDIGDQKLGLQAAGRTFKAIDEGKVSPIDGLSREGLRPQGPVRGKVELKNVDFHYPTRPDVQVR